MTPSFAEACEWVATHLRGAYGIGVETCDIPDPLIGDLDGATIYVDPKVEPEARLFLLAHLFGHTAQWNLRADALDIGKLHRPPVDPALLPEILAYEQEAAAYGLSLLQEAGATSLEQWYSDYTACDVAYLSHYYRTGERRVFVSFWRDRTPLLDPRPVPPFQPARRTLRSAGLVL